MLRMKLHWQILIAIILACFAGILSGKDGGIGGIAFYDIYHTIGTLFMHALLMIVVPLVMSSIITGIAGVKDGKALGRLGGKTFLYYFFSTLFAILVGVLLVNLISPGIIDGHAAGAELGLQTQGSVVADRIGKHDTSDIAAIFMHIIPSNIFQAAVRGELLGLIFFSFLFGHFMMKIKREFGNTLHSLWQEVFQIMMRITLLIMRFAPIGVFGLVAQTVATTGFSAFRPILSFFITILLALGIHLFITLAIMLRAAGGIRQPWRHHKAMIPVLLMAFSSASSSATLPLSLESVEEDAGVSNRVASFVLPLGATVNMNGTALYECAAVLFIAQAYGVHLSILGQIGVVLLSLLTSVGVAGIPAASLVAISVILGTIGIPAEAIGVLMVTDRFLDMCRTAVNTFSDTCGAVIVARNEGETQVYADSNRHEQYDNKLQQGNNFARETL